MILYVWGLQSRPGLLNEAHPVYDEKLDKVYTEYDPAEANRC